MVLLKGIGCLLLLLVFSVVVVPVILMQSSQLNMVAKQEPRNKGRVGMGQ